MQDRSAQPTDQPEVTATPSFGELIRVFTRIGLLSFGGPAGQIALMQNEIVDEHRWVSQSAFLRGLNLCHLLPGPEAQQLATWIGWRLHGVRGGLAAGMLFVVPGALVMLGLSLLYVAASGLGWFAALFFGIKAAVLAIVLQALRRISGRALGKPFRVGLAVSAFVGLAFFHVPFPVVIVAAGLIGIAADFGRVSDGAPPTLALPTSSKWRLAASTGGTIALWLAIWWAPMALIAATLGRDHILWTIGAFFARLAVVSFGGAYAVLTYMAQAAVAHYHWLAPGQMADGLGLAETTPGPLIMVTQFVGFLAGWQAPAPFGQLLGAVLAAVLTTWMTFAPCFLWIFAAAPWLERLEHAQRLQAALAAITAAIVGVVANLAFWFALHVLFTRPETGAFGLPDLTSLDWRAAMIALGASILLLRFKRGVGEVLALAALSGVVLSGLGWGFR